MEALKSNLEKINKLVNPDDIKCWYPCNTKIGRNLMLEEEAYTFEKAFSMISEDLPNLKLEIHDLDVFFIDIDNANDSKNLIKELDDLGLEYIHLQSEREGHAHVLMLGTDDQEYGRRVKGSEGSIITSKINLSGPTFKASYGPVLPTIYNKREIIKIPDKLDKIPSDW